MSFESVVLTSPASTSTPSPASGNTFSFMATGETIDVMEPPSTAFHTYDQIQDDMLADFFGDTPRILRISRDAMLPPPSYHESLEAPPSYPGHPHSEEQPALITRFMFIYGFCEFTLSIFDATSLILTMLLSPSIPAILAYWAYHPLHTLACRARLGVRQDRARTGDAIERNACC
jgi:hypothetical protein